MTKVATILLAAFILAAPAHAADDRAAIIAVMKHDFEKPDHPLVVSPVVAMDGWALAGWTQGEMGGHALLKLHEGVWTIWLCAGDGIVSAAALRDTGLPSPTATALANGMREAEARESPDRVAMFARFQGVVPMGADHAHQ